MKFLREYGHIGLSFFLGCYVLVSITLLKNDLTIEMNALSKDIHTLKALQLDHMPLVPDLKDAYFFKNFYCGRNASVSLKAKFENTGKITFQHKIIKKEIKDNYPIRGEWWYLNGSLIVKVIRKNGTKLFDNLKDVYMDESGGILSARLEDIKLSRRACE